MKYDVVIVGGGAAGLSAALYAARRTLKTLVVAKDIGGQTATTMIIENYPGVDFSTGPDLMLGFQKQAQKFGAEFLMEEAIGLEVGTGSFLVQTDMDKKIHAEAVVLSFGLTPKSLEVPGEKELRNKGVCYCATCDAPLYKGKTVAVVGQGAGAFDAVLLLSKIAKKVYLVTSNAELRGAKITVEQIKAAENVEIIYSSKVARVLGKQNVTGLELQGSPSTSSGNTLAVNGVFVELGYTAKTGWLDGIVERNGHGEIIADRDCRTSVPGVFCAGDVGDIPYKQVVISAGEGAKAALQAYKYILDKQGKRGVFTDWS